LIIPLATGLQKVFSNGENINYSNIRIQQEGESERINMMLRLLKEKKGQPSYAMILIEKAEIRQKSKVDAEEYDLDKEAQQRINDLEQELQFSRENLQATIEELETSNEELQATNEELLASNEELQSTNEELQSVNEELHTVNAEFQSKIMELAELNNDMDNLLNSIDIGTVFLDENLEIRKFTAAGKNLFNITPKDIGRPFSHFQHNLKDFEILPLIISVKTREKPIERQVQTENGNWYILRILPYYITQKVVSGIVITTINIDELIEMRRKLAKREEWLSTAAQLMRIGYWEIDSDTGITHWSDGIYDIHEVEKSFDHNVENGINFYHPQDQPKIESAVKNALENGIPFDLELRFVTAKGNHLWVRTIGKVEKKAGRVMRVFGAFQDITSLKRTEIDLHNSLVNQHKLEKILQKEQGDNHDT
jgi:two-component system CheB/CheR fusion protein